MYARVAVNLNQVNSLFDYQIPETLLNEVKPGSLVVVPFGKQTVQGIVYQLAQQAQVAETRSIVALLDPEPVLTPAQLHLAQHISEDTLSPLAVCLELMLPPGLSQRADTLYHLNRLPSADVSLPVTQKKILNLLQERGDLRGRQLETAFSHANWKTAVQALTRRGWVTTQPVLPTSALRPKTVRTVSLCASEQGINAALEQIGRPGSAARVRRQAVLDYLLQEPEVEAAWVYAATGAKLEDLYKLAELGLLSLGENEIWRDPLQKLDYDPFLPPELTYEQQAVWDRLLPYLHSPQGLTKNLPVLLYGVTGSGKTEIYLRAVEETIRQGKQAIIMVPEIALTPQTVRRFMGRFPGKVGLIHSRLSPGERYDTWRRARAGLLPVIVGPRSALFTPMLRPGILIADECHDDSYFQGDTQPFFSAVHAAIVYARLTGSLLILGSATPQVELFQRAEQENWPVLRLPNRVLAHSQSIRTQLEKLGAPAVHLEQEGSSTSLPLPPVKVVDMRLEFKAGNRTMFSRPLQEALQRVLQAKQQAILFLNRRGMATYVFCRDCGEEIRCPRCDLPLIYHQANETAYALVCHTCNYHRQLPGKCPKCQSPNIRHFGAGTEKVETEIQSLFPSARLLRLDADTARHKGALDIILTHFGNHQADILIGTQMIAKGLDIPLVTLVGILLADVGLNLPDFRAAERTFQLLTQVSGRAGRSPLGGEVVLQSFQPDAYPIQCAAAHDVDGFTKMELKKRQQLAYPPYSRLARLEYRHANPQYAQHTATMMAATLTQWIEQGRYNATSIIGPAPCFFSKRDSYYRWQIILRSPDPIRILREHPLNDWRVTIDPPDLL